MDNIKIGRHTIGDGHGPFMIAEMSGNHNGSLDRALNIIDAIAESGAHAVKLQTYTADTMTVRGALTIEDPDSPWNGRELYDLYQEAHTPWEWHAPLFARATERGLVAFSSPFDETAVDFLEELNVPLYKIASFENTDWPLLKKVAATGKPVIMSTGVITLNELKESVQVLRDSGCKDLILLKCTSAYPSNPEDGNITTIPDMSNKFTCYVGLSDHTLGIGVSVASTALGAKVIEKHFTLNRADGGVDSAFSMEPSEFKSLVEEVHRAYISLGKVNYDITAQEKNVIFKRSIYVVKDIKSGDTLTRDNIRVIRPGHGLHPKHFEKILGKVVRQAIEAGTPLSEQSIR